VVEAPEPSGDEDRDFLEMLSEFKSKVSEHLGEEDAESRYDLGLAFKEMGLLDEAIAQFQVALRGMESRLKVYEELGDCFVLKGDYSVALKILQGALRLADDGSAELIGVHYKLGRSYEELGRVAEARDAYERVIALDLEFRDASSRLARL
jgi:tetratricopeptide (TPR) repeat protein